MEVHQHAHSSGPDSHRGGKKWHHYFWEFFMLFLAVTLGFLVENIRETKIEHKRAKGYAGMLKLDLQNDTLSLNNLINILKKESLNREFIDSLFNKNLKDITITELRRKDTISFLMEDFLPNNATLEQMKRDLESIYGGMSNEHLLQYGIKAEEFLNKSARMDSSISALKAGYKFDSWMENKKITEMHTFFKSLLKDGIYPDLKRQATNLIAFLNSEYSLK